MYNIKKHKFSKIKSLMVAILVAIYPPLYHYGNNADILLIQSLLRTSFFYLVLSILYFGTVFILVKKNWARASIITVCFLVFFNIYGFVFKYLYHLDFFQIEHYSFLPLFFMLVLYVSKYINKVDDKKVDNLTGVLIIIIGVMVSINVIKIIPIEVDKAIKRRAVRIETINNYYPNNNNYPDIYYIVLDEFVGFEAMRDYWGYEGVDNFVDFLDGHGFFVAENTHSSSESTLYELATRLNYQEYPCCDSWNLYFEAIADNKVIKYLKEKGYTTVVFEQSKGVFPANITIVADFVYESDPDSPPLPALNFDEFDLIILDNTMLSAFSKYYKPKSIGGYDKHRSMIFYTLNKVKELHEIPSPKFIYIHLLIPHMPFIYDPSGLVTDPKNHRNWNYYLDNYKFSIRYSMEMIDGILAQTNSTSSPIIIFQSDHGARNQYIEQYDNIILINYPEEYKTLILYTLLVPGLDTSDFSQDINPINTFPIIFNFLFNDNIELK